MRIAFLSFVAIVLVLSLYPLEFDSTRHPAWNLPLGLIHTRSDWVDLVANFFFYLPLGFLAVAAFGNRPGARTVVWVTLCGMVFSYSIEVAQLYMPRRFPSWRDVFLNTAGTAAGAWLATWPALRRMRTIGHFGASPAAWWLLLCWITWLVFPYYPALQMVQLRRAVEHTLEEIADPSFPLLLAGMHFFGGAILAAAARMHRSVRWLIPALALVSVAWMGLIYGLRFSPGRVLATLAGFGLAALFDFPRRRQWLAFLAGGWLAFYAFRGCDLSATPRAFEWTPFHGLSRATLVAFTRDAAGKVFLISGVVWSLRNAGVQRRLAGAAVLGLVAVGEWAQRFAPDRSPAMTDIVLAALAVGVVFVLELWKKPAKRPRK